MNKIYIKRTVHILLLIITILLIISGYGITHFRIVSPLTLNIVNKAVAFKLHSYLAIAFIVLLAAHIINIRRRK
ncbi:MAG: hypothetical protein ABH830_02465 [Patescibacteria group bacterium]